MRRISIVIVILVMTSCGGAASSATYTSSSARVATNLTPVPTQASYGLLIADGNLEMIGPDAAIAASVPMARSSLVPQACGNGMGAWLLPAVSASKNHVYFRDGDTKIKMIDSASSSVDVTTVPGGPNVVSAFAVSPDDQRIAVVVEDFSSVSTIPLRLYVEDLRGGGHHADIFTTSSLKGKPAAMLWPMGWHQNQLILGVWAACTFEFVLYPREWHVADATTADRLATIGDPSCVPGAWPSAAGVGCFDPKQVQVRYYDWSGAQRATLHTDNPATVVSPSGALAMWSNGGPFNPNPTTTMLKVDGSGVVNVAGATGCLWIDDQHVLATDSVITYPTGAKSALARSGQCAGRFPGEL